MLTRQALRRDEQRVTVNGEPSERVVNADAGQMRGFGGQGQRIDKEVARQVVPLLGCQDQ